MSKVSDQKAACGYTPKVVPSTCGNCKHFASDRTLSGFMLEINAERAKKPKTPYITVEPYTVEKHGIEGNLRCAKHGFAVKKMAGCDDYGQAVK